MITAVRFTRPVALTVTAALLTAALAACGAPHRREAQDQDAAAAAKQEPAQRPLHPFTLVATGDILSHDSVIRQARADAGGDPATTSAGCSPGPRPSPHGADVAICHMETVYGRPGGPFTGYPTFLTPPDVAAAIRATGYDSCSTASNHTLDAAPTASAGRSTPWTAAGLEHAGRPAARANGPARGDGGGGAKMAQLSYTYGTNGIPIPKDRPWSVNMIDPKRIIADARTARRAGADVVVVSTHWGTE